MCMTSHCTMTDSRLKSAFRHGAEDPPLWEHDDEEDDDPDVPRPSWQGMQGTANDWRHSASDTSDNPSPEAEGVAYDDPTGIDPSLLRPGAYSPPDTARHTLLPHSTPISDS